MTGNDPHFRKYRKQWLVMFLPSHYIFGKKINIFYYIYRSINPSILFINY